MRRCLIAIFALHFFLSVSAFAFGEWAHQPVAGLASVVSSATVQTTDSAASVAADASTSHALVDELPDLPDGLPRTRAVQKPPVDGGSFVGYWQHAALPPSLEGLLRPPQPTASAG